MTEATQEQGGAESSAREEIAARYFAMPEQFHAVTHAKGLPVQPIEPRPAPQATAPVRVEMQKTAPAAPAASRSAGAPAPVPSAPRPSVAPVPALEQPDGRSRKRTLIIVWSSIAALVVIGGGLVAYFVLRSVPASQPRAATPVARPPAPAVPTPVPTPPPAPVPEVPSIPETPPPAPGGAGAASGLDRDSDGDGLSAAEEALFGTDAERADSDGDGFRDAQELLNLYNPAGTAPARLLDTGVIYEYENPRDGWKISMPKPWAIIASATDQRLLTITTADGDTVATVRIEENLRRLPLTTWVNERPDAVVLAPLKAVSSKRGVVGYSRTGDDRVVWFAPSETLVLTFEHAFVPSGRYATAFAMIVQSFAKR